MVITTSAARTISSAGVVDAQEQHGGLALGVMAFDASQGVQEPRDGGVGGELGIAGGQEPFDGLRAEHPVELAVEPGGGGLEGESLVPEPASRRR
jgi:hypothetical protein